MFLYFNFTIPQNSKHKLPCSRTEKGKIVFVNDKNEKSKEVKEGERWECLIFLEKPNFIIVDPVRLVKTKEELDASLMSKIASLSNKGFVVKIQKKQNNDKSR